MRRGSQLECRVMGFASSSLIAIISSYLVEPKLQNCLLHILLSMQLLYEVVKRLYRYLNCDLCLSVTDGEGWHSSVNLVNRFDAVSAYMRKMDHYGLSDF